MQGILLVFLLLFLVLLGFFFNGNYYFGLDLLA